MLRFSEFGIVLCGDVRSSFDNPGDRGPILERRGEIGPSSNFI